MLKRLGFTEAQYNDSNFNLLKALGFKASEIEAANEFVTGTMTIEGAPFLKEEHYPVFDTANKCGNKGTRFLHAHAHIRMMASAQPFISGAISKTINLPNEATVEDIKSCYELSWKLGIKANALYRDGCKLSQPLSNKSDKKTETETTVSDTVEMVEKAVGVSPSTRVEDLTPEIVLEAARLIINSSNNAAFKQQLSNIATRKILPNKRKGFTQKSKIDGNTIFVRTGEYEDGTLGEIFVDMHKEGASFRSLMNCFAIAVSIGLQYGVPLEEYYDKFTFSRFEPSGMVEGHANIKSSTSVVDFIFRLLGFEYLNRQEQLHIKPKIADEITPVDADVNLAQNEIKPSLVTETSSVSAPKAVKKPANLPPSMGDAPACKSCGNITVRSGTCYTCLTCGTTSGCS